MFQNLSDFPPDPYFDLFTDFRNDPRPNKINIGIGIYTNKEGGPFVFPSIQQAASEVPLDDFNYQPVEGNTKFLEHSSRLVFGDRDTSENLVRIATCGGTHACRIFANLIIRAGRKKAFIGVPTWLNHFTLFGNFDLDTFPHLDENQEVDFASYEKAVKEAENGSVLLLQGGQTHNPVGKNITNEQLAKLLPIIKEKDIFVFVDFAYLGMGESLEEDRKMLQLLWDELDEFAAGLSYSKNASLYEQRTGGLFIKAKPQDHQLIKSNLKNLVRGSVSTPPGFGQKIMNRIFEAYEDQWHAELAEVQADIADSRKLFVDALPEFDYLKNGAGMFGLLTLSPEQAKELRDEHAIFIVKENGRINFAGVKPSNIERIAEGIRAVL